jgi:tetratricopeptide (TPR) repeat protein
LTLACSVGSRDEAAAAVDSALDAYASVALVRFRAGLCRTKGPSVFAEIREADPEFVEADYVLGVYALGERPRPDYDAALERLINAADAFPQSPTIWSALGELRQLREEWIEALAAYDHLIERVGTHRDALLGRTVALSRLERHEQAIAAASRVIDLGGWYIGQASYWRAWNELALDQLAMARADADRAKTQMVNAAVFLVSGLIERRFTRLESAEREFDQAHSLDASACDASFYLGVVRGERAKLETARTALMESDTCYTGIIAALHRRIDEITAGPGRADLIARLVAGQQRAIDDAQMRLDEAGTLISQIAARLGAN